MKKLLFSFILVTAIGATGFAQSSKVVKTIEVKNDQPKTNLDLKKVELISKKEIDDKTKLNDLLEAERKKEAQHKAGTAKQKNKFIAEKAN